MGQATLTVETTIQTREQPTVITVAQDTDRYPSSPEDVLLVSTRLAALITKFQGDAVAGLLSILPADNG